MYYRKNSVRNVCRTSKAKTPNPKFWCDAFCLHMASAFGFIARICRASLTSFFRNTKLSFSSTAAFGTDTPIVSTPQSRKLIVNFGYPKFQVTSSVINLLTPNSMLWDGELLKYGSANLNQRQKTKR